MKTLLAVISLALSAMSLTRPILSAPRRPAAKPATRPVANQPATKLAGSRADSIAATGQFEVRGPKIYDPQGKLFIIKGANIGLWRDDSGPDAVSKIKSAWKFNAVRVFLRLKDGTPEQAPTDEVMDKYVRAFTGTQGGPRTVVMFECHDFSGSYYTPTSDPSLAQLRAFWKRAAARYKSNPYVWLNVMNEPGGDQKVKPDWLSVHSQVLADIRAEGAPNVVVADGNNFAAENAGYDTRPTPQENSAVLTYGARLLGEDPLRRVVFSFHCYTAWNFNIDNMADYVDRAQAKNLAIFIGEYAATTGSSAGDYGVLQAAHNSVRVARTRGIGRMIWHFTGWDGNALTNGSTGMAAGDAIDRADGAKPGNLSAFGDIVWNDQHDIAAPSNGVPLNRLGWVATASGGQDAFGPQKAIDNLLETRWGPGAWEAGQWLQIDMGVPQSFDLLTAQCGEAIRSLRVQASNDGQGWRDAGRVSNNRASVLNLSFAPQRARYVRLWLDEMRAGAWPSITELELWRVGKYLPPAPGKSLLPRAGWTATASKKSGWNQEWEDKALDDDPGTRYTGGKTPEDGDWIVVDMKATQQVKSIVLDCGSSTEGFTRGYELYVSDSNSKWEEPVAVGLGHYVTRIHLEKAAKGRYLKVVFRNPSGAKADWWSIHDLHVYAP